MKMTTAIPFNHQKPKPNNTIGISIDRPSHTKLWRRMTMTKMMLMTSILVLLLVSTTLSFTTHSIPYQTRQGLAKYQTTFDKVPSHSAVCFFSQTSTSSCWQQQQQQQQQSSSRHSLVVNNSHLFNKKDSSKRNGLVLFASSKPSSTTASVGNPNPNLNQNQNQNQNHQMAVTTPSNEKMTTLTDSFPTFSNKDKSNDVFPRNNNSLRETLGIDSPFSIDEKKDEDDLRMTANRPILPYIVGHRGCLYEELENTRQGFLKCSEMGCHAIELDVFQLPACGTLVVFHGSGTDEHPGLLQHYCYDIRDDKDVPPCQSSQTITKSILDYTHEEAVKYLRFNTEYEEFGCSAEIIQQGQIPTLEEVLKDLATTNMNIKIELKGEGTVVPTVELVEQLQMVHQVSYSSFDHERLEDLRNLRPDRTLYRTGALFSKPLPSNFIQRATDCGATEIHLQYDTCTRQRVMDIHAAGFGSMCWFRGPIGMASDCTSLYYDVGNEDESMYEALLDTGVQQFCVNRPDRLLKLTQQYRN